MVVGRGVRDGVGVKDAVDVRVQVDEGVTVAVKVGGRVGVFDGV